MIVSWNDGTAVEVGANFEKVGAREMSFQKRCVRQLVQFPREQSDDDDNDDGSDDDDDDDGNDDDDDDHHDSGDGYEGVEGYNHDDDDNDDQDYKKEDAVNNYDGRDN